MALIDDYKKFGFNKFLEKEGSLLEGFQSVQFFKTGSISEDGTEEIEEISSGLVTLKTDKLGSQEIKEQIGQLNQFAGGDVTQPINVVFGHIQSANFVTGSGGAGWRIDSDGNLEANTGTFRGAIAATSGTIAAFTIAATTISATNLTLTSGAANTANISVGTGSNLAGMNSGNAAGDIAFWAGATHTNRATAPFRVEMDGSLIATDGTIADFTIATSTLSATNLTLTSGAANTARITVGTGSNLAGMNSANAAGDITFWSGSTHANRATAPFRVEADGSLIATDGNIGGWVITSTNLEGGAGDTITGGKIRTASSGARVEMFSSGIDSYDASNNLRFSFFKELLTFKDTVGATVATLGSIVNGFEMLSTKTVTIATDGTLNLFSDFNSSGTGNVNIDSGLANINLDAGSSKTITLTVASGALLQLQSTVVLVNSNFSPSVSGKDLGASASANRWSVGYINKISGLGTANVIDFGISGRIATNQDFTFATITSEGTPPAGTMHWNSSTVTMRIFDGSAWKSITVT